MHHLISIFLTLLIFLTGGNFAVAKNQVSSASLGNLGALAVPISVGEVLHRQDAKGEKVFENCLEAFPKSASDFRSLPISAPLDDFCALAVPIFVEEVFHRQDAKGEKVFENCLEAFPKSASDCCSLPISAPLGDLCALAVNSSSIRRTTLDGKTMSQGPRITTN